MGSVKDGDRYSRVLVDLFGFGDIARIAAEHEAEIAVARKVLERL